MKPARKKLKAKTSLKKLKLKTTVKFWKMKTSLKKLVMKTTLKKVKIKTSLKKLRSKPPQKYIEKSRNCKPGNIFLSFKNNFEGSPLQSCELPSKGLLATPQRES